VCVCVCVYVCVCVCVCVCLCVRENIYVHRQCSKSWWHSGLTVRKCVCKCVCMRERKKVCACSGASPCGILVEFFVCVYVYERVYMFACVRDSARIYTDPTVECVRAHMRVCVCMY